MNFATLKINQQQWRAAGQRLIEMAIAEFLYEEIIEVKAWDYPGLLDAYVRASKLAREEFVPCLVHVIECTQPQGHSASGSHERYKSADRLAWEHEADCNLLFRQWILENKYSDESTLKAIDDEAVIQARKYQKDAFAAYMSSVDVDRKGYLRIAKNLLDSTNEPSLLEPIIEELNQVTYPIFSDLVKAGRKTLRAFRFYQGPAVKLLRKWLPGMDLLPCFRKSLSTASTDPESITIGPLLPMTEFSFSHLNRSSRPLVMILHSQLSWLPLLLPLMSTVT